MFIVKSCFNLVNSSYYDGREVNNECGNSLLDEKCYEVKDCPYKKIAEHLLKVVKDNLCSSCDGCGYGNGCADEFCGTYAAHKCLELLDIEFIKEGGK